MASRLALLAMIGVLPALSCSEHTPDGPGPGDHTPPGIVAAVAGDVNHLVIVFDEEVTRWSAEKPGNYTITGYSPRMSAAALDDAGPEAGISAAALHDDYRTVTLTTFAMSDEKYRLQVAGVSDTQGNIIERTTEIIFNGTDMADTTPPEVVNRFPVSATKGISTRTFVALAFSEDVNPDTVVRGLRVHGEGARLISIQHDDLLHFTCWIDSLQPDSRYTIVLRGIQDVAGNLMPDEQWAFDTQSLHDTVAPLVVSSWPENGATNVGLEANLKLTFTEAMHPYSVRIRPSVDASAAQWSYGGKTLTLDTTWLAGRQYTLQIRPGDMSDAAGNPGTQLFTLTFSTGAAIETGAFSGTITGDPRSARASDPGGGLVFAGVTSTRELYTTVVGLIGENGAFTLPHLPNGTYYPFCVKDSDGNRIYQPRFGDALGVYGVPDPFAGGEPGSIAVGDGRVAGVDFAIYDPAAVYGLFTNDGMRAGTIRVGLFKPDGFDLMTSAPVVAVIAEWDGMWDYILNTLDTGPIADGSWYVAAYLDADNDGLYNASIDPAGVYGDGEPIAVDLSHGKDAAGVDFALRDPVFATTSTAVRWPESPPSPLLKRITDMLDAPVGR